MKAINKMLIKDLRKYMLQIIAIVLIIFIGITLFSACVMSYKNLEKYKEDFYEDNNFLDAYVEGISVGKDDILKIAEIEGVKSAEGRTELEGKILINNNEQASAKIIAYKEEPSINKLRYTSGKYLTSENQILISKNFAEYHGIGINQELEINVLDHSYSLNIQGIVESPEFIITIKSRDYVMPSIEDYAIVYLSYDTLGLSNDTFNQVHLTFKEDVNENKIEKEIKELLGEKYANFILRKDQISEVMVREDIGMISEIAYMFPIMFLFAAALVIFVVQKKLIEIQRSTIGILKAMGYKNRTIIFYYIKQSLIIGTLGSVFSIVPSYYLSVFITKVYCGLVYIPISDFEFSYTVIALAIMLSNMFSLLATLFSVKTLLNVNAAEAMRPISTNDNERIILSGVGTNWRKTNKMVFTNIFRHPIRTLFNIVCNVIAFTLFASPIFLNDSVRFAGESQYTSLQNYDFKIIFKEPVAKNVVDDLVDRYNLNVSSSVLEYSVKLENDSVDKQIRMIGLEEGYILNDGNEKNVIERDSLLVPQSVYEELGYQENEKIRIEILGYNGENIHKEISTLFKQYVGFSIYTSIDYLKDELGTDAYANGIYINDDLNQFKTVMKEIENNALVKRIDSVTKERHEFDTLLKLVNIFIFVMIIFGLLMGFCSIYNATMMNVIDRKKEWGTLKVLGYSNLSILKMCIKESIITLVISFLPSICISIGVCYILGILMSNDFYTSPFIFNKKIILYPIILLTCINIVSMVIYYVHIKRINTADVIRIKE